MPSNYTKELEEILEDVFSAGEVQMASIQTGKKLPKNYADNRITEARKAAEALLEKAQKEAEIKAYRNVPAGYGDPVELEEWLWAHIDPLEAQLNTGASENAQSKEG